MTDLRRLLQAGDPAEHEPSMPSEAVDRIRYAMFRVRAARPPHRIRLMGIAATVAVSVVAGVGIWVVRPASVSPTQPGSVTIAPVVNAMPSERRQIQFATPGGTRVIWVLETSFQQ
jgi:hypothetical protein